MQMLPIATILLILVASVVTPVFADSFSFSKPDFMFKLTNIIEDIRLGIASTDDKVILIKEFAKDKQTRIDYALSRGDAVPLEMEERRKVLVEKITTVGAGEKIRHELEQFSDLNEVRILYSQFPECIESCTIQDKEIFNEKVNSLKTWKNKCSGTFDIDDYSNTDGSFDALTEKCPDLKKYSKNNIKSAMNGNT